MWMNCVKETLKDGEMPCDMCDEIMKDELLQFCCRVLEDKSTFPETIMIGKVTEYDYYTVCKECYTIAFKSGSLTKWCIRRSEFECLQHERSLPKIKQVED